MNKLFQLFYACAGVSTDTRSIEKDVLYIALKGENFNGNHYAIEAIEKGAKYAIVDEKEFANDTTIFYTENALLFLQKLANYHRNKFNIPVIGITGSNGKTTTKELIASVLQQEFAILYTQGNLNNHIGVPLTLLSLSNEHDIAIIEMGANKRGDIKELSEIAQPTHGIITNIGIAHIEGFGGPEGVLKTKTELYANIKASGGTLFCNLNDKTLTSHIPDDIEVIYYAIENEVARLSGKLLESVHNIQFQWSTKDYTSPLVKSTLIGKYNFNNILAALSIGHYFEVPNEKINAGIEAYIPSNNRSQIKKTPHNTLLLDAYNANPSSMKSALENFDLIDHPNKMVILGDMLELGAISTESHKEIIELTISYQLEALFVGKLFYALKEDYDKGVFFETVNDAELFLSLAQPKNNFVLLKGSRGIGLEKLADIF